MKKNREYTFLFTATSIMTLIPLIFAFLNWESLSLGQISKWSSGRGRSLLSEIMMITGPSLAMLLLHIICISFTLRDNRGRNQSGKVMTVVFWIMPIMSIVVNFALYSMLLGHEIDMIGITTIIFSIMFIITGNYLPKCKRNNTVGVKVKWTLENDDNWRATHRFTGRMWIITGAVMGISAFLPEKYTIATMVTCVLISAFVPAAYSYICYRKQIQKGAYEKSESTSEAPQMGPAMKIFTTVTLLAAAVLVLLVLVTGRTWVNFGPESFEVCASWYQDLEIPYSDIDTIELREDGVKGHRVAGFGSPVLSLGSWKNDEFGTYTRYTTAKSSSVIVITDEDRTLVFSGENTESTEQIYSYLSQRISR